MRNRGLDAFLMRSRPHASTAVARHVNHLLLDPPAVLLYELVALNASLGEYTNGNEVSRLTARHRRARPGNHTRGDQAGASKKIRAFRKGVQPDHETGSQQHPTDKKRKRASKREQSTTIAYRECLGYIKMRADYQNHGGSSARHKGEKLQFGTLQILGARRFPRASRCRRRR